MQQAQHSRLVLAILRRRWDEAEAWVRRHPLDPEAFESACREGDVPTWVHALLSAERRLELIGPEAAARLLRRRDKARRDNLLLIARAEQALDALLVRGIAPVLLKGLDFVHRVYGSFDERTIDDVDLLVRQSELEPALLALQAAGFRAPTPAELRHYVRTSHHVLLSSPGSVTVGFELHWNLVQTERYRVDADELVERSVPLSVGGRSVRRLADDDVVAHLLLHHFTHYFDRRFKWAVDLRLLTAGATFDWAAVATRVERWGATAAVGMSLQHLAKLFPEWIPRELLERLPVAPWRRALTWPLRSSHPCELYRLTRVRAVQLYLAAVCLERPTQLPSWLLHRLRRERGPTDHPLDPERPVA